MRLTPTAYDYVYVQRTPEPESATVYQNGVEVYSTPANTGVAAAPTASGTFPVYLRYQVTTMSGTNPDGSKYVDPGIPWVSYFNGATPCTASCGAATASPRATAASRCRRPTPPSSTR